MMANAEKAPHTAEPKNNGISEEECVYDVESNEQLVPMIAEPKTGEVALSMNRTMPLKLRDIMKAQKEGKDQKQKSRGKTSKRGKNGKKFVRLYNKLKDQHGDIAMNGTWSEFQKFCHTNKQHTWHNLCCVCSASFVSKIIAMPKAVLLQLFPGGVPNRAWENQSYSGQFLSSLHNCDILREVFSSYAHEVGLRNADLKKWQKMNPSCLVRFKYGKYESSIQFSSHCSWSYKMMQVASAIVHWMHRFIDQGYVGARHFCMEYGKFKNLSELNGYAKIFFVRDDDNMLVAKSSKDPSARLKCAQLCFTIQREVECWKRNGIDDVCADIENAWSKLAHELKDGGISGCKLLRSGILMRIDSRFYSCYKHPWRQDPNGIRLIELIARFEKIVDVKYRFHWTDHDWRPYR